MFPYACGLNAVLILIFLGLLRLGTGSNDGLMKFAQFIRRFLSSDFNFLVGKLNFDSAETKTRARFSELTWKASLSFSLAAVYVPD